MSASHSCSCFPFFLGRNSAIVFLAETQLQASVVKQSTNTDSDIAISFVCRT